MYLTMKVILAIALLAATASVSIANFLPVVNVSPVSFMLINNSVQCVTELLVPKCLSIIYKTEPGA